ncbi:MAG: indolepyruvate oxidoreductase subunit beta [Anaerolineae bacterium]
MTQPDNSCNNFMVVGVGGQGTLLAAEIIAVTGVQLGYDVKKSEIHGMAQRGGSVSSQVRWGRQIYAPVFGPGEVDYLIALERLEALRYAHWLRQPGCAVISDYRINPLSVTTGQETYPSETVEEKAFSCAQYLVIPALALAEKAGQSRANNVVLLGALSVISGIATEAWESALKECIPTRYLAVNQAAFESGRRYMLEQGRH